MPILLPSLGAAVAGAHRTLRRFPLAIGAGAVAAAAGILMFEELGPEWLHGRLTASASLGIAVFTAAALLAERQRRRGPAQAVLGLAGLLVLAGYFAGWPHWAEPVRAFRYAQLSVAAHLLVVLVPFARTERRNAFWQFSRVLLERAVLAAVFSGTLFLGLALALAALDNLFGVDVPDRAYGRVWLLTAFLFNTWFFLGGVPEDPRALEERRDYPAVLRVFARYALVPLVSVYLVILTVYLAKVVVTWDWPNGWIGWLVSGVAGAGILTLLLVSPIAEDAEQRWIATFSRGFWFAAIPSLVMLWLALYQRVHQYGVTERRYLLIALSLWLAGLAAYYAVTRSRNIRLIPATLCVASLLTFAGPWGPYAVSEASQVGRLRATLERNGMFADGALRRPAGVVGAADRTEISAVVRYLLETHGTGAIAPWFADPATRHMVEAAARAGGDTWTAADRWAQLIVSRMGVAYVDRAAARSGGERASYAATEPAQLPVRGFDYLLPIRDTARAEPDSVFQAVWSPEPPVLRIVRGTDTVLVLPLDSMLARMRARAASPAGAPEAPFAVEGESRTARAVAYVRYVAEKDTAGTRRLDALTGRVLLALKR